MSSEELTVPAGAVGAAEPDGTDIAEAGGTDIAEMDVEAAAARSYPVVADVNVRSGPGTSYAKVGRVQAGTRVSISCQRPGETVTGPTGTSKIWDKIGSGRYVSDTYVRTGSNGYVAPRC
ncbi:SH3 domain-containing protein [Streptomyces alboflavus]|uniref:SH3 domain-containing protein n=1 Tax=Streptomyces alboflavus TaxID=67267 RepID=UPI0004C0666C|nr:SH3 domain-containing protein [Streptomyces alboflavus]